MSFTLSWWLPALIVGASSPLWIRAIVNRWERLARERSARIVAQYEKETPSGDGDIEETEG